MTETAEATASAKVQGDCSPHEVAYKINCYLKARKECFTVVSDLKGTRWWTRASTTVDRVKKLEKLQDTKLQLANELTRMGITMNAGNFPRGIRVDNDGVFVCFDPANP